MNESPRVARAQSDDDSAEPSGSSASVQTLLLGNLDLLPDQYEPAEDSFQNPLLLQGTCYYSERDETFVFSMQFDPDERFFRESIIRNMDGRTEFESIVDAVGSDFETFVETVDAIDVTIQTIERGGGEFQTALEEKFADSTYIDDLVGELVETAELIRHSDPELQREDIIAGSSLDFFLKQLFQAFVMESIEYAVKLSVLEDIKPAHVSDATMDDDDEEGDPGDSSGRISVTARCDPHNGLTPEQLEVGDKLFVQIIGDKAKRLPDAIRDCESTKPKSIPLRGMVSSIGPHEEPEEFLIQGNLDSDIAFRTVVHQNDRLKIPGGDSDSTQEGYGLSDYLELGLMVCGLVIVLLLLMTL